MGVVAIYLNRARMRWYGHSSCRLSCPVALPCMFCFAMLLSACIARCKHASLFCWSAEVSNSWCCCIADNGHDPQPGVWGTGQPHSGNIHSASLSIWHTRDCSSTCQVSGKCKKIHVHRPSLEPCQLTLTNMISLAPQQHWSPIGVSFVLYRVVCLQLAVLCLCTISVATTVLCH